MVEELSEAKPKKTSVQSRKSAPVTTTCPVSKKLKTAIDKINTISAKEEETTQKVLDLKKLKTKGENDKALAKIKAKADLKMQQMKHKAELTQQKLEIKFQLQMAQMGHHIQAWQAGPSNAVHSSAATSSRYLNTGSAAHSTFSNDMLAMGTEFNFSSEEFNFLMPDYQ